MKTLYVIMLVFCLCLPSAICAVADNVKLNLLQPVYRNSIYATENDKRIVFTASAGASKVAGLSYKLVDMQGKTLRSGKAAAKSALSKQVIDAKALPVGEYTLQVELSGTGGTLIGKADAPVRVLAKSAGSEVRVDEKRNILVNGKPKLFIGWYGPMPTEDPRKDVVALMNVVTPKVIENLDISSCRELWEKYGVYTVISIDCANMIYTFSLWKTPGHPVPSEMTRLTEPSEEAAGYLKQIADKVKNEPWLLGYYLSDEPEINNVKPEYLESVHKLMQRLDPYHPVIITNDTIAGIETHGYKACDILNPDPYDKDWDYVPSFLRKVLSVAPRGKGIMTTLWHTSGQAHFVRDWGTEPVYPYKVMRHQYLVSAAMGSRGFTGYITDFYMPEPELRYGLPPIWRELRFLEPALANTQAGPKVFADVPMVSWIGSAKGNVYLIVANTKKGSRKATVSSPLLQKADKLFVMSEGRTVKVTKGAFVDNFAEGDVHVYTTDAGSQKLALTTAVEKNIVAETKKNRKPGNLLHVDNGVLARATPGFYTPWYDQYYYYAINGVTDDLGWYLSHAGGKESTLELVLPAVKEIGRVVVYTPNVADYDLLMVSGDGTVRKAEVRGNTADVSEVGFDPAVSTVKLKMVVTAARTGSTQAPIIREIEAYESRGSAPALPVSVVQSAVNLDVPSLVVGDGTNALWDERFESFKISPSFKYDGTDTGWLVPPERMKAEKTADGLQVYCVAPEGTGNITSRFDYDPKYRYIQIKIDSIDGEPYPWANIQFKHYARLGYKTIVHTRRSGIYTTDLWQISSDFQTGLNKWAYLDIHTAGSTKTDTGVTPGPKFNFSYVRLVQNPVDGLVVTLPDGSPLPQSIKEGDSIMFRVLLEKPAIDVTVEAMGNFTYTMVPISGQPNVQLYRIGNKDGREWGAVVKLGPGTGKYDGRNGYPVFFRAVVTGGSIKQTQATMDIAFE